ncbi:iron ABC transporter permease [Deinococcus sp.]|uniref:FecCD family ABC transporter permease n=1 Tax=Deinococcus sp. TaxID=47478 RepID=UPI002869D4ED|nr:iron ABC transporter permease [Deinococcus sp.]
MSTPSPAPSSPAQTARPVRGWATRLPRALGLAALVAVAVILGTGLGSVTVPPGDVLAALWRGVSGQELAGSDVIVWQIRLPRVVMGLLVGAALSMSGGAFQGVFRNPLADPYLLGVASGSALGATVAIVLNWPRTLIPLAALVCALGAVALTLILAREGRRFPPTRLILSGVVIGSVLSAVSTALILRGQDRARLVLSYTLGDLGFSGWHDVATVLPYVAVGGGTLLLLSRALDTLQLGDLTARSLGVPVERLRLLVVVAASVATAGAVAYVGIIGFVGLIVPHIARLAFGAGHRTLLLTSAVLGGAGLVLADLLARTTVLSQVGIVTTLLGGPFFLWLLRRQRE